MTKTSKITYTAIFAAIATVLMYFEFPIPFMPPFLKVDLSGAVVLIGAFIFGIAPAITMIGIKDLIHLTQTQTAGSGEAADFLMLSTLVIIAVLIVEEDTVRLSSITSRSANLLDVIRHADRCIEVHDKFNIGNINTHTECRSHNHNLSFAL